MRRSIRSLVSFPALLSLVSVSFLAVPAAHALEPDEAFFETRAVLERAALREINERILSQTVKRDLSFDLAKTVYAAELSLRRGDHPKGRHENYFGTIEVKLREPEGVYHHYFCRLSARVEAVSFAKQPPGVVILEQVANQRQVIARPLVACQDGRD